MMTSCGSVAILFPFCSWVIPLSILPLESGYHACVLLHHLLACPEWVIGDVLPTSKRQSIGGLYTIPAD